MTNPTSSDLANVISTEVGKQMNTLLQELSSPTNVQLEVLRPIKHQQGATGGNAAWLKRCSSLAQVQLSCVALLQQAPEQICCHHCPTERSQVLPVNQ